MRAEDGRRLKIPKGQIHWETHLENGEIKRIVTSDETRRKWYLYSVGTDGTLTRIASGASPAYLPR